MRGFLVGPWWDEEVGKRLLNCGGGGGVCVCVFILPRHPHTHTSRPDAVVLVDTSPYRFGLVL
jgi:hypothetical protein